MLDKQVRYYENLSSSSAAVSVSHAKLAADIRFRKKTRRSLPLASILDVQVPDGVKVQVDQNDIVRGEFPSADTTDCSRRSQFVILHDAAWLSITKEEQLQEKLKSTERFFNQQELPD
eukprot:TRINITY_DN12487_c1_g6_i1.p2 TRINITY_DN12487_c1_g6~~TRINITY_DN12487_c1_g6_i1.p2  ORF type:complete len:118 (+),score=11.22 TRINITY_DN12487_c1_g6_i1:284-637(+)